MSSTQDPEELVVCPYDPVHRVAAKKLPYHISKCRKQYDKNGEYKTCPFNARHVVPAPEFHYHMETCDSKGAIDMEIAFEQSKNEVSHSVKGCTDIPPPPSWERPGETENWDDEDEDAPPVLHPQPIRYNPPANLPRPTASRPISRFDPSSSPMSRKKSPSRFPSGGLTGSPRGGRSSRASRGRQVPSRGFEDEQFSPIVRPRATPSPESLAKEADFPPLLQNVSSPNRDDILRPTAHMSQPTPSPQPLPEQQQQIISSPLQFNNAPQYQPQPYFPPNSSHEHLFQSSQPVQVTDPLVSYQNLPHNPSQTQAPVCNQQIAYPPLYPPQPQPIQYLAPPMSVPLPPQPNQLYPPPNSQQYVYSPQATQQYYMPPANPAPPPNYYIPQQQQPLPPQLYQTPQMAPNALPQPGQPYPPMHSYNSNNNHYQYPPFQGNMIPSAVYDQSSVVTTGGGSSPGRGRGRGVPPNSSPPKSHYPSAQNLYQSAAMQPILPQMDQLQISSQPACFPPQQQQQPHQAAQGPAPFPQQSNSRHSMLQSVAAQPNSSNGVSSPQNILPQPGGAPTVSRLNQVKVNLATIALIEYKRDSGSPLSREEVELLATKGSLLEQLK